MFFLIHIFKGLCSKLNTIPLGKQNMSKRQLFIKSIQIEKENFTKPATYTKFCAKCLMQNQTKVHEEAHAALSCTRIFFPGTSYQYVLSNVSRTCPNLQPLQRSARYVCDFCHVYQKENLDINHVDSTPLVSTSLGSSDVPV